MQVVIEEYSHYDNGTISTKFHRTIDGVLEGECVSYRMDGTLESISHYVNDRRNGRYTSYSESGVLLMDANFRNDQFHGEQFCYREDGTLSTRRIWNKGRFNGECRRYFDDECVWDVRFYCKDVDISKEIRSAYDVFDLTDEDKFAIRLRWGIECLGDDNED